MIVFIRGETLSAHSARKIPGWIVVVRENFSVNKGTYCMELNASQMPGDCPGGMGGFGIDWYIKDLVNFKDLDKPALSKPF